MLFPNHTRLWSSILIVASVVARSSDLKGNFASYCTCSLQYLLFSPSDSDLNF